MKIILLRHGRPHMPKWPPILPRDMERWIDAYNRSGIDFDHQLALRPQSRVIEITPPPYRYDRPQVGHNGHRQPAHNGYSRTTGFPFIDRV